MSAAQAGAPAIVFIGFMGAGKSTALAAAREAGLETIEVDEVMAREMGMPITEAFEQFGEEGFREREAEVVGGLLERAEGGAIALGGGSVLSPRIREALGRHTVVWLQVDSAEAWSRIAGSGRPLATSAAEVERLLATRLPLYEELADAVLMPGDRGIVARALPTVQALAELPAGTRLLWATSASGEYPILVGRGLLGAGWWPLEGRRFLVSDQNVGPRHSQLVEPFAHKVLIRAGEGSKDMATAAEVLEELARNEMLREDHVVALGGGVVGDLAGLCAHLYQRGTAVVQVPTTLVAQVDSAYGGKTGVDLPQGKNYAGAYHQPAAVLVDTGTLTSLPPADLGAGFVEALKTGLLAGGSLWERVRSVQALVASDLDDVVFECARYKCEVVAADERDAGLRHVLNLGHTVGHALEAASGYGQYRHGEAIGIGLLAALRLSDADDLRGEVEQTLRRLGLPTSFRDPAPDTDVLMAYLRADKKRTAAGVGFVLLAEPGQPRTGQLVPPDDLRAAVEELYA
jgi:shikimate kinase / 3-dehydroquinate synthase